ncbi:MAG: L-histidine N(alpha)-methyltransferase [Geodermatophilaceae bacterium]
MPVDVSDTAVLGAADLLLAEYPDAPCARRGGRLRAPPGTAATAAAGGSWHSWAAPLATCCRPSAAPFWLGFGPRSNPARRCCWVPTLVKSPEVLVAAYNDSAGVTAAFNKNVLYVLNRELKADFEPDAFVHVAVWDAENEWIEMRLRSLREQRVSVAELNLEVDFAQGEEMRTEVSAKFRRERVREELSAAGFRLDAWWTDAEGSVRVVAGHRGVTRAPPRPVLPRSRPPIPAIMNFRASSRGRFCTNRSTHLHDRRGRSSGAAGGPADRCPRLVSIGECPNPRCRVMRRR